MPDAAASYTLECGAIMPGCPARFIADTESELLEQVAAHAAADHDLVDLTDDVVSAVRGAIVVS